MIRPRKEARSPCGGGATRVVHNLVLDAAGATHVLQYADTRYQRGGAFHSLELGSRQDGMRASHVLVITIGNSITHGCSWCQVAPCLESCPVHLGEKLRLLREHRGLSQSELARQVGLASHTHISNLEAGRKAPSLDLVVRLAALLGTTTDYLLRNDVAPEPLALVVPAAPPTVPVTTVLARRLRNLRWQQGLTQVELAQRLGLAANAHISFLERSKKEPSIALIVQIADCFGVTTDDLLRESPSQPTHDSHSA